jgi:hypothetical protein
MLNELEQIHASEIDLLAYKSTKNMNQAKLVNNLVEDIYKNGNK